MPEPNLQSARQAINDQFPDLAIQTMEPLGEGFRNYAVLVNGEWVFRFPKSRQGADELEKEIRLLPLLHHQVKAGIPKFEFIGRFSDGRPFAGYRKVSGEVLGEDGFAALSNEAQELLASQLADFMNTLKAFPVELALQAGVPGYNHRADALELWEAAQKQVYPIVAASVRDYLDQRFQSYLNDPSNFACTPALIHADLSPDHFLMDPLQTQLTGIIDFGDAAIGDPDYDYLYLLEDCGEPFTRQVMLHRGVDNRDVLLRKVSWFVTFDQVRYLLEGLASGEEEWIAEGVEVVEDDRLKNAT